MRNNRVRETETKKNNNGTRSNTPKLVNGMTIEEIKQKIAEKQKELKELIKIRDDAEKEYKKQDALYYEYIEKANKYYRVTCSLSAAKESASLLQKETKETISMFASAIVVESNKTFREDDLTEQADSMGKVVEKLGDILDECNPKKTRYFDMAEKASKSFEQNLDKYHKYLELVWAKEAEIKELENLLDKTNT